MTKTERRKLSWAASLMGKAATAKQLEARQKNVRIMLQKRRVEVA